MHCLANAPPHHLLLHTQVLDPDLVEHNLQFIRETKQPMWLKYVTVSFFMLTWKWFYYAPNTFKMLKVHELRRQGKTPTWRGKPVTQKMLEAPWTIYPTWLTKGPIFFRNTEFFVRVLGPFFFRQFILLPALFGVVLILLGALVQSLQYAFEEKVMSADVGAPPLLVIGMEGFWGTVVCTLGEKSTDPLFPEISVRSRNAL